MNWQSGGTLEGEIRELSGLVFPKQVFNQVYTTYLYTLVKMNSLIQNSTEFCISVAHNCMQTQKQEETYLVVKNPLHILAWRILQTEEPGGLQSIALHRVGHNRRDFAHTHTHTRMQTQELNNRGHTCLIHTYKHSTHVFIFSFNKRIHA